MTTDETIDPEILALTEAAADWLACVRACARALGATVPQCIAALAAEQRIYTGYMPESQRRSLKHRALRDGLRTRRPTNPYDAQKAIAREWGHAC